MPAWGVHLVTTKEILDRVDIKEKNDFIFGNILPDIENGYLVKGISHTLTHKESHFDQFPLTKYDSQDVFLRSYGNKLDNKVILGYVVHLLTDNLWNKNYYERKVIYENGKIAGVKLTNGQILKGDYDVVRILKQKDYKIYADSLFRTSEFVEPVFDKELVNKSNEIEIININEDDIKKSIQYIQDEKEKSISSNIDEVYQSFNKAEIKQFMSDIIDEIVEYMNKNLL